MRDEFTIQPAGPELNDEETIEHLTKEVERLEADNMSLAKRCDELIQENNSMRARLEELEPAERYIEIMQRRLNNINHEMNAVREELAR